ncbi:MAG TPA: hypothetical protein PLX80_13660 [Ignavibacteria bacterium]|nr:hypothetical protein [Ignavibacteria bacterium]
MVSECRAVNQPFIVSPFTPPIEASYQAATEIMFLIFSPARLL